jgi:hypothetical protein
MSVQRMLKAIPQPTRRDLLRYFKATSRERATVLPESFLRSLGMADVLADLEAGEDTRLVLEAELVKAGGGS